MLDAREAFRNYKHPIASWPVARRRLRSGRILPETRPSFTLAPSDVILTMGSCFARNIEEHLVRFGCRVPALEFTVPGHERRGPRPNHVLTLFTPPLFHQEIAWAERIRARDGRVREADCTALAFEFGDGSVLDLGLAGSTPVSRERFLERRQQLYELYATAFTANCVVMTPGLVEAWYDKKTGQYINPTPLHDGRPLDNDRFAVDVLDYAASAEHLFATVDIIRRQNPKAKILITVSPVPLRFTFTGADIVVANTYSKSVLRAACEAVVRSRERIDYFPSYEAVMLSSRGVWQKDRRHVTDRFVRKIVADLTERYFPDFARNTPRPIKGELSLTERIARLFRRRTIDPIRG